MSNYVIEHEGRQFSPDGAASVSDVAAHNRAVEAGELAAWELRPERFAAYVNGAAATTFLGTKDRGGRREQSLPERPHGHPDDVGPRPRDQRRVVLRAVRV